MNSGKVVSQFCVTPNVNVLPISVCRLLLTNHFFSPRTHIIISFLEGCNDFIMFCLVLL